MVIYSNSENEITKIIFEKIKDGKEKEKYESQSTKDKIIKAINCNIILEFCNNFPKLTDESIIDVLELEENIKLRDSLKEYFEIILGFIKNEQIFNDYNELEKIDIKVLIEDFIHEQYIINYIVKWQYKQMLKYIKNDLH